MLTPTRSSALAISTFPTFTRTSRWAWAMAIHCAAEKTADEPFFVLLGDVIVPDNNICPRMLEVSAHTAARA